MIQGQSRCQCGKKNCCGQRHRDETDQKRLAQLERVFDTVQLWHGHTDRCAPSVALQGWSSPRLSVVDLPAEKDAVYYT